MNLLLLIAVLLISMFVVSIPLYRLLLARYAPRRYAQLKAEGRFRTMPATWVELWLLWTEPESNLTREVRQLANIEDRRVFYGRFVDRYLMPIPYIRAVCTYGFCVGIILLIIWLIGRCF
jgi:hypothetical protein